MKPLIVDNFLNQEEFNPIADLIVNNFQWKYDNFVDYADDKDKFQFTHSFYKDFEIVSPFHETLKPIWNRIRPREIYRVKANLLTRTPEIVPNRLIIWPSNFLFPHSVLPVTKGLRYSVVAWAF